MVSNALQSRNPKGNSEIIATNFHVTKQNDIFTESQVNEIKPLAPAMPEASVIHCTNRDCHDLDRMLEEGNLYCHPYELGSRSDNGDKVAETEHHVTKIDIEMNEIPILNKEIMACPSPTGSAPSEEEENQSTSSCGGYSLNHASLNTDQKHPDQVNLSLSAPEQTSGSTASTDDVISAGRQAAETEAGKDSNATDQSYNAPLKILIRRKDMGDCTEDDFALVQRSLIKARLAMPKVTRDTTKFIQIPDSRLIEGKVEITVWDELSKTFVMETLNNLKDLSVAVDDGTTRFSLTLPANWFYEDPMDLINMLECDNPKLPLGALTFVSWMPEGPDGWRVIIDVSKEGNAVLQDCNFTLKALFGTLQLSPLT